jgi:hypothetical protein
MDLDLGSLFQALLWGLPFEWARSLLAYGSSVTVSVGVFFFCAGAMAMQNFWRQTADRRLGRIALSAYVAYVGALFATAAVRYYFDPAFIWMG